MHHALWPQRQSNNKGKVNWSDDDFAIELKYYRFTFVSLFLVPVWDLRNDSSVRLFYFTFFEVVGPAMEYDYIGIMTWTHTS